MAENSPRLRPRLEPGSEVRPSVLSCRERSRRKAGLLANSASTPVHPASLNRPSGRGVVATIIRPTTLSQVESQLIRSGDTNLTISGLHDGHRLLVASQANSSEAPLPKRTIPPTPRVIADRQANGWHCRRSPKYSCSAQRCSCTMQWYSYLIHAGRALAKHGWHDPHETWMARMAQS